MLQRGKLCKKTTPPGLSFECPDLRLSRQGNG
jgi:hypothetical protein